MMSNFIFRNRFFGILLMAGFLSSILLAQGQQEEPKLDPMAAKILRTVAERLQAAQQFYFRAEIAYDMVEVADDEEGSDFKVQYHGSIETTVRRHSELRISYKSTEVDREFWYDGKTAVVLAPKENYYSKLAMPNTIDQALDAIKEKTGFSPPLTDFVYSNPTFILLSAFLQDGIYLGLEEVGGVLCHHIVLRMETIDWQAWIDGKRMLPRKFIITYKEVASSPQFTAVYTDWDFYPFIPDDLFIFKAPPGAIQVETVQTTIKGGK
jgi:hypothetical protein